MLKTFNVVYSKSFWLTQEIALPNCKNESEFRTQNTSATRACSHLAPKKVYVIFSLSIKPKALYLAKKVQKSNVTLSHRFLQRLGSYK
jgi:hypothetical protein